MKIPSYQINYLRQRRSERGLTQEQVAKLLGCEVGWINRMETHGRYISDKYVYTLCKAWNIKAWELIDTLGRAEDAQKRLKELAYGKVN